MPLGGGYQAVLQRVAERDTEHDQRVIDRLGADRPALLDPWLIGGPADNSVHALRAATLTRSAPVRQPGRSCPFAGAAPLTPGAEYCTGIGQRKVRHLSGL
jgi:hypothetical protein